MEITLPVMPPDEPCVRHPVGVIEPPCYFVQGGSEGRLIQELKDAAVAAKDDTVGRLTLLTQAAERLYKAQLSGVTSTDDLNEQLAFAFTDLAITGREAYTNFCARKPQDADLISLVTNLPGVSAGPDVAAAVEAVLDRAYNVAWALRGSPAQRSQMRPPLGWIAVSGEDDPPHRPVNVVSAPYPQFDFIVTIPVINPDIASGQIDVRTRFFVASPQGSPPIPPPSSLRTIPPDPLLSVPEGDQVILFIHGHSSRAEEALDIVPHLHQSGLDRGLSLAVISLDLPNNGYSSMFDHTLVAKSEQTAFNAGAINVPILDFIEEFICQFVGKVDNILIANHQTPIKERLAGVIGGSLGGNMGLRLGRRDLNACPWLGKGIVSWDPASVWPPMVQWPDRLGPDHCRDKWDEAENNSFSRANYFSEVFFGKNFDGKGKEQFFDEVLMGLLLPTQPETWYRDGWEPCKSRLIRESRLERHEIYHQFFRQWHWRVAGEQLIFSHIDREVHGDSATKYWYELNQARALLAAGKKDDYQFGGKIYSHAHELAERMTETQGTTLFLEETGHSIHVERPRFFAEQIVNFLFPS